MIRLMLTGLLVLLGRSAWGQVELPTLALADPIVVSAEAGNHWVEGTVEIWVLRGSCQIRQGAGVARSREGVIWIYRGDPSENRTHRVIAYLEGNVSVETPQAGQNARLTDQSWLGRFTSRVGVHVRCQQEANQPDPLPPIYERAQAERNPGVRAPLLQTQYVAPIPDGTPAGSPPPGTRRLRAFARGESQLRFEWVPEPATNQWVALIDGGVNVIVDGLPKFGSLDVSADRAVLWTAALQEPNLSGHRQADDTPLELYLEGNIVFRQGNRVIYAERMYYNVRTHVGTVIEADMLTPVGSYQGLLRLHSRLLQQVSQDHFYAQESYFTSSRLGVPGYRVQASDVTVEDIQEPAVDPLTGQPIIDPETNQPVVEHHRTANGRNGVLYLGDVPVFYWPMFATDLERPDYYVRRVQYKNDGIFGNQFDVHLDPFQIFGIRNKPPGTDWDFSLDYMSHRGLGHGTSFLYNVPDLFSYGGPTTGLFDYWGIKDTGRDNLGPAPLNSLQPGVDYRYRLLWQHRQQLPDDLQLTAEVGKISDINFLNQYFPREWNELKDQSTDIELKQYRGNSSWSIFASGRLDDFNTETEWLPRLDHFWLGQPLLNDTFTWYEHSQAAYAQYKRAKQPALNVDPLFTYLPWETNDVAGERLVTRQELDYPFQLGPVKVVPYALGELAHWGQDLQGQPLDRMYGATGVRASLPVWSVNPNVESQLWNVHGLAHKVIFEANAVVSGTNKSFQNGDAAVLPLYDSLDDYNLNYNRRMFGFTDYGQGLPATLGVMQSIPKAFDPRYYALRSGMGEWVTSPSTEVADDLAAVRLAARQRWQTKRGPPSERHITDWITLDTDLTVFPNPDHDNFGRLVGLADYDFHWFVGDRLTLLSSGIFDFFTNGQKAVTVGGILNRPPRGSLYLGFYALDGPIHSQVVSLAYSYWMSPKWVSQLATSVDIGGNGNIGQSLSITRVGESFLVSTSFSIDAIRGTTGVNFMIEPRFFPGGRLNTTGSGRIPVAGANGLE